MSAHEHWDITVDTPVGQQSGSLELRVTEAACTGRLYSEAGELALQNGTAQDNELSWNLAIVPTHSNDHRMPGTDSWRDHSGHRNGCSIRRHHFYWDERSRLARPVEGLIDKKR